MPWLTDPSITNQVQPAPNFLDSYARFSQIKNLGVQNQLAQQRLQQEREMAPIQQQAAQANLEGQQQQNQVTAHQLQTRQLVQKLLPQFTKAGTDGSPGLDFEGLANAVLQNGGDPSVINALQKQRNDAIESTAKAGKAQIELNQTKTNFLYQGIQGVKAFPVGDPRREAAYQKQIAGAKQLGLDTSQFPPQAPDNDSLTLIEGQLGMTGQLLAEAKTKAETAKAERDPEERNPTEASLAMKAASGDKVAEAALKRLDASKRASRPVTNVMTNNDAKDIADAIENGDQPPSLQGLYRNAGPVRAELARRGFNLAQAESDWKATQKHLATLNGSQQVRLQQSISSAGEMLDKVDALYQEWSKLAPTSGFKVLNKATLASMKQLPGRAGAVATALDAQIADVTADLGNIYMGGNSPTDHALSLAQKALSGDWNKETFEEGIKQARSNVAIRANSIKNSAPTGVSANNPYSQPTGGALQQPMGGAQPAEQTATGPGGHKIALRGGKWVDAASGQPIQ